ncbi:MAG TPA: hypothetical protein VMB50_16370 [Myxococcales bacterium]|nr:hypothetical protein [Myxococcales bacterium]
MDPPNDTGAPPADAAKKYVRLRNNLPFYFGPLTIVANETLRGWMKEGTSAFVLFSCLLDVASLALLAWSWWKLRQLGVEAGRPPEALSDPVSLVIVAAPAALFLGLQLLRVGIVLPALALNLGIVALAALTFRAVRATP